MTITLARVRPGLDQDALADMAASINLRATRLQHVPAYLDVPVERINRVPPTHRLVRAWVEDDRLLVEAEEMNRGG